MPTYLSAMGRYNWREYRPAEPLGRPLRPGESWYDEDDADRRSVPVHVTPEYLAGNAPPHHHKPSATPVKAAFPELKGFSSDYRPYVERLQSFFEAYFTAIGQTDILNSTVGFLYDKFCGFIEFLGSNKCDPHRILEKLVILENQLAIVEAEIMASEKSHQVLLERHRKHERIAAILREEDREIYDLARPVFEARSRRTAEVAHIDILVGLWNAADDFLGTVRNEPFIKDLLRQQRIENDAQQAEAIPLDPSQQTLGGFLFELFDRAVQWPATSDGPTNEYWTETKHRYREVPESERRQLLSRLKAYENATRGVTPQLPTQIPDFLREMRRTLDKHGVISQALVQIALLSESDDSEYFSVAPDWSEPVPLHRKVADRQDSDARSLSGRIVAAVRKLVG